VVTKTLDAKALRKLSEGGKVLLLPDPSKLPTSSTISVDFKNDFWSPMFHSDGGYNTLGTLIRNTSKAFAQFPTDNFNNFQWYSMMGKGIRFDPNKVPADFKPLVQPIPTIDQGYKYGTIFEAKVGSGKLLVSTIDLQKLQSTNQEAKQLLKSLQDYVASDDFQPQSTLDTQYLSTILPASTDILATSVNVASDNGISKIEENSGTLQLTAVVQPSDAGDKSVTWSLLDPDGKPSAIAEITATDETHAILTAKRDGTVRVVAKANAGFNAVGEKAITISNQAISPGTVPVGVTLDTNSFELSTGSSRQLKVTASFSDGTTSDVTAVSSYLTSDSSITTVDENGIVRPEGGGEADITAIYQGLSATAHVKSIAVSVTGVSLDKDSFSLMVNGTRQLKASVVPANALDRSVTWSSSDPSVAVVDSKGHVTAV
jgi:uncharacterized protein YjdB